jgi:hypothetical protein
MELKRGWWKEQNGGYAYVVVFRDGWWHGLDSDLEGCTWLGDGRWDDEENGFGYDLTDTYCGDGPEPVEPVQLGLGWWERMDGGLEQIIEDRNDGPFRWANKFGSRWNDKGQFSRVLFDYSDTHSLDIVRRRPDLDAKEALQAAKPDPRYAVIDCLKAENAKLKNDWDNLKRIIDDH